MAVLGHKGGQGFVVVLSLFLMVLYLFDLSSSRAGVIFVGALGTLVLSGLYLSVEVYAAGVSAQLFLDLLCLGLLFPWLLLQYRWEARDLPEPRVRALLLGLVGPVATAVLAPAVLDGAGLPPALLSHIVALGLATSYASFALPRGGKDTPGGMAVSGLPPRLQQACFFLTLLAPPVLHILLHAGAILRSPTLLLTPRWAEGLDAWAELAIVAALPVLLLWPQTKAGALAWLAPMPHQRSGQQPWERMSRSLLRTVGYEDPVGGESHSALSLAGESLGIEVYAHVLAPLATAAFLFGVQQRIVQRLLAPMLRLPPRFVALSLACATMAVCIGLSTLPRLLTPPLHAAAALPLPGRLGRQWLKPRGALLGGNFAQESSLSEFDGLQGVGSWRSETASDVNLEKMLLRAALALSTLSLGLVLGSGWRVVLGALTAALGLAQFLIEWRVRSALVCLGGLIFWLLSGVQDAVGFLDFEFRPFVDARTAAQLVPETFFATAPPAGLGEGAASLTVPGLLAIVVLAGGLAFLVPFLVWSRVRRPSLVAGVFVVVNIAALLAEMYLLGPAPEEYFLSAANDGGWADGACDTPAYPSYGLTLTALCTLLMSVHLGLQEAMNPIGTWLGVILAAPRLLSLHCPRSLCLTFLPSTVLPFALTAPFFLVEMPLYATTPSRADLSALEATLAQTRILPPNSWTLVVFGLCFYGALGVSQASLLADLAPSDLRVALLCATLFYLSVLARTYLPTSSVRVWLGVTLGVGIAFGLLRAFGMGLGFDLALGAFGALVLAVAGIAGLYDHSTVAMRIMPFAVGFPFLCASASDALCLSIWTVQHMRRHRIPFFTRTLFLVVGGVAGLTFGLSLAPLLFAPLGAARGVRGNSGAAEGVYAALGGFIGTVFFGTVVLIFGAMPGRVHPSEHAKHVSMVTDFATSYGAFAFFALGVAAKYALQTKGKLPIYRHAAWASAIIGFGLATNAVKLTAGSASLLEELSICVVPALFFLLVPKKTDDKPAAASLALPGLLAGLVSLTRGLVTALFAHGSFHYSTIHGTTDGAAHTAATTAALANLRGKLADSIRELLAAEATPRLSVLEESGGQAAGFFVIRLLVLFVLHFWAFAQLDGSSGSAKRPSRLELLVAPLPLLVAILGHRREEYCLALLTTALLGLSLTLRQKKSETRATHSRELL